MRFLSSPLDRRRAAWLLGAAFVFSIFAAAADAPPRTLQLKLGSRPLTVEVAADEAQREKGLMFRDKLGKNAGMLFIFEEPGYYAMWMKNTLIPLSVAFVDANGVILNIEDMAPQTLDTHMAAGPARYAIETNLGWFGENKVKPGDKVTGLPRAK